MYVCPLVAQSLIVAGAAVEASGSGLLIGGRWLMGTAGKVFAFASPLSAGRWAQNAGMKGQREAARVVGMTQEAAARWKAPRRDALARRAVGLMVRAMTAADDQRAAAMREEAAYCLAKWGE